MNFDRSASADTTMPHHRRPAKAKNEGVRSVIEWVFIVVVAVSVALLVRWLLFQPFFIPSESMVPTLKVGDRVLVNLLGYKLHDIHRGDIIVFKAPPGEATPEVKDLVKRVIGLPGDTVQGKQGDGVYINGRKLEEPYLPAGITSKDFGPVTVPPDELFVMGDNRFESKDSTYFGPIKKSSVIGRAFLRFWPLGRFGVL